MMSKREHISPVVSKHRSEAAIDKEVHWAQVGSDKAALSRPVPAAGNADRSAAKKRRISPKVFGVFITSFRLLS